MNKLKYPSFVDRYFTKYFFRNKEARHEDICILAHSNKICLITLSPRHKALAEGPLKSVSYDFNGRDLAQDVKSAHGKKKLDAIKTHPYRCICNIVSGNGTTYKIRCGIQGKLLEVNEKLIKNPTILNTKNCSEVYLGIVLHSNNKEVGSSKDLLTQDQYDEVYVKEEENGFDEKEDEIKKENIELKQEEDETLGEKKDISNGKKETDGVVRGIGGNVNNKDNVEDLDAFEGPEPKKIKTE